MLAGGDGIGGKDQAQGIKERACHNRFPVAKAFGHGAEHRLADPPCKVLDRDGQRKLGPRPAEFAADRNLEHPETGANGEGQHQDDAARHQNGGHDRGVLVRGCGHLAGLRCWRRTCLAAGRWSNGILRLLQRRGRMGRFDVTLLSLTRPCLAQARDWFCMVFHHLGGAGKAVHLAG